MIKDNNDIAMIVTLYAIQCYIYHQISNLSKNTYQNAYVFHLLLQLSLYNPLKPVVNSRMKM